ncbi:hypothetical protein C8R44DRAFT_808371 [Mycena epipterygia]|nr:hypothetical protein C8R44DRAFT_808371 [Mycena epipterygia]
MSSPHRPPAFLPGVLRVKLLPAAFLLNSFGLKANCDSAQDHLRCWSTHPDPPCTSHGSARRRPQRRTRALLAAYHLRAHSILAPACGLTISHPGVNLPQARSTHTTPRPHPRPPSPRPPDRTRRCPHRPLHRPPSQTARAGWRAPRGPYPR